MTAKGTHNAHLKTHHARNGCPWCEFRPYHARDRKKISRKINAEAITAPITAMIKKRDHSQALNHARDSFKMEKILMSGPSRDSSRQLFYQ